MENMENGVVEETTDNSVVTTGEENVTEQSEQTPEQEKKYTDSDVDKIVAKRVNRERERLQKLFQEEQQVSELDERERKIALRELKADAKDLLEEAGLPLKLASALDYTDSDSLVKSIEEVGECFRTAVAFGVKDAIRGSTPRGVRGCSTNYDVERERLQNAFKSR